MGCIKTRQAGYCPQCGWHWPEEGKRMCTECLELERFRVREKKRKANREKAQTASIEEVIRMARERGVSYGQMVAILEGRHRRGRTARYAWKEPERRREGKGLTFTECQRAFFYIMI